MARELLYVKVVLKLVSKIICLQLLARLYLKAKHEWAVIALGDKSFTCSHPLILRSLHSFWQFLGAMLKVNSTVVFDRV